jgi:acyl carrier protein phosphodiesterase
MPGDDRVTAWIRASRQLNYLAHLYLSPPGEDAMLGSVLGDFVKGPLTNIDVTARYSPEATRAMALHRKIDSYTDAHPVVTGPMPTQ